MSDTAIEIRSITKRYFINRVEAVVVDNLSLEISKGEVFGFLGANGAGKTTTIKMLVGLTRADKGSIKLLGKKPQDMTVRERIGFMPESPAFYSYLTGVEFLGMIGNLFNLSKGRRLERTQAVLEELNLSKFGDLQIRKYSKGMQQRLGIAQALLNDPEILFMDEPLDGLDPFGRTEVKRIVTRLRERGKTIFFNSHILADVEEICTDVGIIDRGKLIARGSVKEIVTDVQTLEKAFTDIVNKSRSAPTPV